MLIRWIDATGHSVAEGTRYCAQLAAFLYLTVKSLWLGRGLGHHDFLRQILLQIYFTGVQAVPPTLVIAVIIGVLTVAQGMVSIGALSGTDDLGRLVTVLLVRQLSPLITG